MNKAGLCYCAENVVNIRNEVLPENMDTKDILKSYFLEQKGSGTECEYKQGLGYNSENNFADYFSGGQWWIDEDPRLL